MISAGVLFFLVMSVLFVKTYYTHREFMDAANKCYDHNGMPEVERSTFSFEWSVICHP